MQGVIRAVGYPIFGLDWTCHQKSGKKIIAIAGGGGSSKSGIKNRVTVCEVDEDNKKQAALKEVLILESGDDLITNISVQSKGEFMACGVGAKTFLYSIDKKCSKFNLESSFETDFAKPNPFQNVVLFNHKGDQLVTGGEDGIVRLWKLPIQNKKKPTAAFSCTGHTDYINSLHYDESDRMLVSSGKDGNCNIWNAKTGKKICTLPPGDKTVPPALKNEKRAGKYIYRSCRFVKSSQGPSYLITILTPPRGASYLAQWTTPDLTDADSKCELLQQICLGQSSSACSLATRPGYIAVGGSDGSVTLFDANSLGQIRVVRAHHLPVTGVAFKPVLDDAPVELMSASADYSLYLMRGHGSNVVRNIMILLSMILILLASLYAFLRPE